MGRTLTRPRLAALVALLVLGTGCPDERPRTQVMVIFEADRIVERVASEIEIEVYAQGTGEAVPSVLVQSMRLDLERDFEFPVSHAVVPRDEREPGIFRIEGRLFDGQRDEPIAHVRAITGFVREQTLALRLRFHAQCLYVDACVDPEESCNEVGDCAPMDDLPSDLPPLGGEPDAGPAPLCRSDLDCDDGVACTDDACVAGSCLRAPNDARCTTMTGGTCDATAGCQYGPCTTTSCVREGCDESATCAGGLCTRTSACRLGEGCCGTACVAPGCNDGDACTIDACTAGACTHDASTGACDDGVFCNGLDTCTTGGCDAHAGNPCGDGASCDEDISTCALCASATDCPAERIVAGVCVPDASAPCGGGAGTRSETTTRWECTAGACVRRRTTVPTASCTAAPLADGAICGTSMEGPWGACLPASTDPCEPDGIETRTVVVRECASGVCVPGVSTMETRACVLTPTGCGMDAGLDGGLDAGSDGGVDARAPDGGALVPTSIAAGHEHTCFVAADGSVWCWGNNLEGQLGDGSTLTSAFPVPVAPLGPAMAVEGGRAHTCALLSTGEVYCWGDDAFGQLGDGGAISDSDTPVLVLGLMGVTALAVGGYHACALHSGGSVSCWGENGAGQLGDGTMSDRGAPTAASVSMGSVLAAGESHTCAILGDGTTNCWGDNSEGQLGDGSITMRVFPTSVSGTATFELLALGRRHSCAVDGGAVSCWGAAGTIGDGAGVRRTVPSSISGLAAVSMDAGTSHTCVLGAMNIARCWGTNDFGQLGDGTRTASDAPVVVSGLTEIRAITAGATHTCAILLDGSVWCWGNDAMGQRGDGFAGGLSLTPVTVVLPAAS